MQLQADTYSLAYIDCQQFSSWTVASAVNRALDYSGFRWLQSTSAAGGRYFGIACRTVDECQLHAYCFFTASKCGDNLSEQQIVSPTEAKYVGVLLIAQAGCLASTTRIRSRILTELGEFINRNLQPADS